MNEHIDGCPVKTAGMDPSYCICETLRAAVAKRAAERPGLVPRPGDPVPTPAEVARGIRNLLKTCEPQARSSEPLTLSRVDDYERKVESSVAAKANGVAQKLLARVGRDHGSFPITEGDVWEIERLTASLIAETGSVDAAIARRLLASPLSRIERVSTTEDPMRGPHGRLIVHVVASIDMMAASDLVKEAGPDGGSGNRTIAEAARRATGETDPIKVAEQIAEMARNWHDGPRPYMPPERDDECVKPLAEIHVKFADDGPFILYMTCPNGGFLISNTDEIAIERVDVGKVWLRWPVGALKAPFAVHASVEGSTPLRSIVAQPIEHGVLVMLRDGHNAPCDDDFVVTICGPKKQRNEREN